DGLAINLRYERGVLTSAATRGDGRVGEVVTENALRVAGIPERLAGESHPEIVEVRGEVFIPVEQFHELNALQASLRERAFAEARERWERVRSAGKKPFDEQRQRQADRKSTRLNSSHVKISYAVFCLKKKKVFARAADSSAAVAQYDEL